MVALSAQPVFPTTLHSHDLRECPSSPVNSTSQSISTAVNKQKHMSDPNKSTCTKRAYIQTDVCYYDVSTWFRCEPNHHDWDVMLCSLKSVTPWCEQLVLHTCQFSMVCTEETTVHVFTCFRNGGISTAWIKGFKFAKFVCGFICIHYGLGPCGNICLIGKIYNICHSDTKEGIDVIIKCTWSCFVFGLVKVIFQLDCFHNTIMHCRFQVKERYRQVPSIYITQIFTYLAT